MQTLGGEDVSVQQFEQRTQGKSAGADMIGHGREAEIDAFEGIAIALAVQRLMLAELGKQHHGEQAWTGKSPRDGMERRRRLRDPITIAAGELLAHCLNDLPAARDDFERLGDVFAELPQPIGAAARTGRWNGNNDPFAR
jgi:hypothetical protein